MQVEDATSVNALTTFEGWSRISRTRLAVDLDYTGCFKLCVPLSATISAKLVKPSMILVLTNQRAPKRSSGAAEVGLVSIRGAVVPVFRPFVVELR